VTAPAPHPVLVVDDNPETREVLLRVLALHGHPVVAVRDGHEALDYLVRTQGAASVIILDLFMQGMTGPGFLSARAARTELARIPVIVYSGYDVEPLPNVAAYVRKSADPAVLLDTIGRLQRLSSAD
jgi:CheY-like chemotaxis protein